MAFPYQRVIKCSFKSSTVELLNSIRIAWKLPLFTDAVLLLSSLSSAMASERDVLFATQYYDTYDCSKQVHIFVKHLLILRGNS